MDQKYYIFYFLLFVLYCILFYLIDYISKGENRIDGKLLKSFLYYIITYYFFNYIIGSIYGFMYGYRYNGNYDDLKNTILISFPFYLPIIAFFISEFSYIFLHKVYKKFFFILSCVFFIFVVLSLFGLFLK